MEQNPSTLPTSGKAIAALILGIVAIPTCLCYGVPSLICGILALVFAQLAAKDIAAGKAKGSGMVLGGRICGGIGIALAVFFWVLFAFGIKNFMDEMKKQQQQQSQQQSTQQP